MRTDCVNYLWRKHVTAAWLTAHEVELETQTGGAHAVITLPGRRRIVIERFCDTESQAAEMVTVFGGAIVRLPVDWEARFLETQRTKPLRIGRRLIVCSGTEPHAPGPTLLIPAGAAFGTGEHATTAMSLRFLEEATRKLPRGWTMLDAGTGSGILALAGKRFGAATVVAVDNDPKATRTARANARANHLRGVRFITGDIHQLPAGAFDIITANLYSELLLAVLPRFRRSLRKDGGLILSGVLREQESKLRRALKASGFRLETARRRGKWVALLYYR